MDYRQASRAIKLMQVLVENNFNRQKIPNPQPLKLYNLIMEGVTLHSIVDTSSRKHGFTAHPRRYNIPDNFMIITDKMIFRRFIINLLFAINE